MDHSEKLENLDSTLRELARGQAAQKPPLCNKQNKINFCSTHCWPRDSCHKLPYKGTAQPVLVRNSFSPPPRKSAEEQGQSEGRRGAPKVTTGSAADRR